MLAYVAITLGALCALSLIFSLVYENFILPELIKINSFERDEKLRSWVKGTIHGKPFQAYNDLGFRWRSWPDNKELSWHVSLKLHNLDSANYREKHKPKISPFE